MNPAQILAIISLLLAFNVPQPTVDIVQGILNNDAPATVVTVPAPVQDPTPSTPTPSTPQLFGSLPTTPIPTCQLTAATSTDSAQDDLVALNWTTQNAQSGSVTSDNVFRTIGRSATYQMSPIDSGEVKTPVPASNFYGIPGEMQSVDFIATVSGQGGAGTCSLDLINNNY